MCPYIMSMAETMDLMIFERRTVHVHVIKRKIKDKQYITFKERIAQSFVVNGPARDTFNEQPGLRGVCVNDQSRNSQ